ncbi:MAG: addiction module protein [Marmoricola sp.]
MTVAELLEQAGQQLTPEEQRQLAHDLWVQADGPYEDPVVVEAAWANEVADRLTGIVDGSTVGLTDEDVRKRFGL